MVAKKFDQKYFEPTEKYPLREKVKLWRSYLEKSHYYWKILTENNMATDLFFTVVLSKPSENVFANALEKEINKLNIGIAPR